MGQIQRGSTPTHIFNTNIDLENIKTLFITYNQKKKKILEKTLDDCTIEDKTISVRLSQEDTLAFDDKNDVEIQIRIKFLSDDAIASNIVTVDVNRVLKEGVI